MSEEVQAQGSTCREWVERWLAENQPETHVAFLNAVAQAGEMDEMAVVAWLKANCEVAVLKEIADAAGDADFDALDDKGFGALTEELVEEDETSED